MSNEQEGSPGCLGAIVLVVMFLVLLEVVVRVVDAIAETNLVSVSVALVWSLVGVAMIVIYKRARGKSKELSHTEGAADTREEVNAVPLADYYSISRFNSAADMKEEVGDMAELSESQGSDRPPGTTELLRRDEPIEATGRPSELTESTPEKTRLLEVPNTSERTPDVPSEPNQAQKEEIQHTLESPPAVPALPEITAEMAQLLKESIPNRFINLSPRQFEEFIGQLFRDAGYQVRLTKQTGDFGADLIIQKGAISSPSPRTSPISGCRVFISRSRSSAWAPTRAAFSVSPSLSMISRVVSAARAVTGFFSWV